MIANALNDKPLPVYGEGINVRDWLYVEDHCAAIDLIIRNGKEGEVYNVGGHNEMRNIDIVKLIVKHLGKSEDLITFVTDRAGHDMRYAIDPTKIHHDLGWLPQTKFEDGIQKTIGEDIKDGKTFEENAMIKAKEIAKYTDEIVLADDSGLEIDYLNKEPGIYSDRGAGREAHGPVCLCDRSSSSK